MKIKRGDECALAGARAARRAGGGRGRRGHGGVLPGEAAAEALSGRGGVQRLRGGFPAAADAGGDLRPAADTALPLDVRVKFVNGDVLGSTHMGAVAVYDAISEVVL